MEPALDERGDACATSANRPARSPPGRNGARSRRAGRRGEPTAGGRRHAGAAMEPALDERGDLPSWETSYISSTAAMEPALDERGDFSASARMTSPMVPQWSPLSTSGATSPSPTSNAATACRNGARSRRAGRLDLDVEPEVG